MNLWERFAGMVAAWNVYGLPILLLIATAARARAERAGDPLPRAARRLGWIHLGLAAWSLTRIADELWAFRSMGIFPSNPVTGLFGSVLAMAVDIPLGLGLIGLRRWARTGALGLWVFRLALAAVVLRWSVMNGAVIDLTEWPRLALSYVVPPFALAVLFWPGMGGVFRGDRRDDRPGRAARVLAMGGLLLLIVLANVVATDAIDVVLRALDELAADAAA